MAQEKRDLGKILFLAQTVCGVGGSPCQAGMEEKEVGERVLGTIRASLEVWVPGEPREWETEPRSHIPCFPGSPAAWLESPEN